MNMDDTTNPVDGGDTSADIATDETGVETEVQDEPQLDDDGNPIEEEAEEEDELDIDDETKLKLPKSQAQKIREAMLRQADYTRKTQELAEARKAFEAERATVQQASEAELTARANLSAIDRQLSEYAKIDWRTWQQQDPFAAQEAFTEYQLLKDAKTETTSYLGKVQQERTLQEKQEIATRMEQGAAEIAKEIPEWSKPEYRAKVKADGQKHYGFSSEDLDGIDDPKVVRALNDAVKWREHLAKEKKAQSLERQTEVAPAAKAGSQGRTNVTPATTNFAAFEKLAGSKG